MTTRLRIARSIVAAMLFAQLAVTVNACLAASSARVEAVASAAHEGCEMRRDNPNVCLYHCADQYASANAPQTAAFSPALLVLPSCAWVEAVAPAPESWAAATLATGPPITIRNCCFRI